MLVNFNIPSLAFIIIKEVIELVSLNMDYTTMEVKRWINKYKLNKWLDVKKEMI